MQERSAETKRPGLRQGDQPIPGFRLVRRRGGGGFGEVWEAEAAGGIHVALKFVHFSPRAQAAELRALNCVRHIHHPNLLANFGSWQVDGALVVGMELADGSLWDRYIEASNVGLCGIPRGELLGYMAHAADGLDFLNEPRHTIDGRAGVGILHRDIKPPNILLFGGGAKVADLGMARAMEGHQGAHTGIWTFPFAAPEFFRGLTTRQSDQYGLAATYCQLRCGRLPFEGNAAAVTAGHLYGQPDLEALPEAERPILERALSKEPGDRWPNCRDLVEALGALDASEAPELLHRPDDPVEDIPRRFRSSTGASGILPGGPDDLDEAPHPSWHSFDSTGDPESLMRTAESARPSPTPSGPTAILSPDGPGVVAGPPDHRRSGRIRQYAAATITVGIVIAAAGIRPMPDLGTHPEIPPAPPAEVRPTSPGTDPEAEPDLVKTPTDEEVRPASSQATEPSAHEIPPPPAPGLVAGSARPVDPIVSPPTGGKPAGELPDRSDASEPAGPAPLLSILGPAEAAGPSTPTTDLAENRPTPEIAPSPAPTGRPAVVCAIDPAAASAAEARGRAHLDRGEFERAIVDFDQAIKFHPGKASSYFLRGLARHQASHYPEALVDYTQVIRFRSDDPRVFIARGQAHHDLGAYDRAIADYTRAIQLRPDDPSAYYRRGLARYWSDDYAGALADFNETIRLDPTNSRAREFRDDSQARFGGRTRDNHKPSSPPGASPASPAPPRPSPGPTTPPAKGTVTPRPAPGGSPTLLIQFRRMVR